MTGLEVVGATAAALQITQQIWNLSARIFTNKPRDREAVASIRKDARDYSTFLQKSETQMKDGALQACRDLRTALDYIVTRIDRLNQRKKLVKWGTALKLYKSGFREKFADALQEFYLKMLLEGQKSVDGLDGKLAGMTKEMEKLKITAETLADLPGAEETLVRIQQKIDKMSEEMRAIETASQEIRGATNELKIVVSAIVPEIERVIKVDGDITRENINRSTTTITDHVDSRLDMNESLTRIRAEQLPNANTLVWRNGEEKDCYRIWSLDENPEDLDRSQPSAEYEGTELSAIPFNETIEAVYTKRHIAEELDDYTRERKRRRANDLSPYVGLIKRGEYFEELQEYIPPNLRERYEDIHCEVRKEAVQVSRRLSQEYRYAIYDRILQEKAITLPKLYLVEDMERAMLALQVEKLEVDLSFYLPEIYNAVSRSPYFPNSYRVHVSSVGYKVSVIDRLAFKYRDETAERQSKIESANLQRSFSESLHSLGRAGLGEIMRRSFVIFKQFHGRSYPSSVMEGHDGGIANIFNFIFNLALTEPSRSSLLCDYYSPLQQRDYGVPGKSSF